MCTSHLTKKLSSRISSKMSYSSTPLLRLIIVGWPDDINNVPHALCPYCIHRNTLTVEDGLILRDEALIIPLLERKKILQAIHEGHMGISKCQNRARQWCIGLESTPDIKHFIESCPTFQHHCPQEPWQPLQPTLVQEHPWQLLGTDYFHSDGSEYLVVTDYYSKMPIIRRIPASQCNASQDHLSPEGTLCRTLYPRDIPY